MTAEIKLSQKAATTLRTLPKNLVKKVEQKLESIQEGGDLSFQSIKMKSNFELFMLRVDGSYRLIYRINEKVITVVDIVNVRDLPGVMRTEK